MAELQGSLGQWWWHYDPRDGRVSGSFPVYSVHQHGMAPMSFRTLARAGGPDLSRAIEAGRSWLSNNELGVDLVDHQAGTIWRSIVRDERLPRRLVRHTSRLAGPRVDGELLRSGDLILADGIPIIWASWWLVDGLEQRVTGVDLMSRLIEEADRDGLRLYFFGARPEVVDRVVRRIESNDPGAVIAGARDGYFGA